MAIETTPGADRTQPVGGGPGGTGSARAWWMKPAVHTALIGAVIGYLIGHWVGNILTYTYPQLPLSDSNDSPLVLGYLFGTVGWLAGLGVFNDLGRLMVGKPLPDIEHARRGRPGQVLPVHPRPQGRRHPVPVRDDHLLPAPAACSPWRSGPSCSRRRTTS